MLQWNWHLRYIHFTGKSWMGKMLFYLNYMTQSAFFFRLKALGETLWSDAQRPSPRQFGAFYGVAIPALMKSDPAEYYGWTRYRLNSSSLLRVRDKVKRLASPREENSLSLIKAAGGKYFLTGVSTFQPTLLSGDKVSQYEVERAVDRASARLQMSQWLKMDAPT